MIPGYTRTVSGEHAVVSDRWCVSGFVESKLATRLASWVAEIVLVVPLVPSDSNVSIECRPIGCCAAAVHLADRYEEDR